MIMVVRFVTRNCFFVQYSSHMNSSLRSMLSLKGKTIIVSLSWAEIGLFAAWGLKEGFCDRDRVVRELYQVI